MSITSRLHLLPVVRISDRQRDAVESLVRISEHFRTEGLPTLASQARVLLSCYSARLAGDSIAADAALARAGLLDEETGEPIRKAVVMTPFIAREPGPAPANACTAPGWPTPELIGHPLAQRRPAVADAVCGDLDGEG